LVTLRSGVLPRWVGAVALIGAVGFSIAFLTTLDGTADGSVFGYGFFPGIVALVTWSVATSITRYRDRTRWRRNPQLGRPTRSRPRPAHKMITAWRSPAANSAARSGGGGGSSRRKDGATPAICQDR
jgi:hypothetical protein